MCWCVGKKESRCKLQMTAALPAELPPPYELSPGTLAPEQEEGTCVHFDLVHGLWRLVPVGSGRLLLLPALLALPLAPGRLGGRPLRPGPPPRPLFELRKRKARLGLEGAPAPPQEQLLDRDLAGIIVVVFARVLNVAMLILVVRPRIAVASAVFSIFRLRCRIPFSLNGV